MWRAPAAGRQIGGDFRPRKLHKPLLKKGYLEGLWYYDETSKWKDERFHHIARCAALPTCAWGRIDGFSKPLPGLDSSMVAGNGWKAPVPLNPRLVAESKRTIGLCSCYLRPRLYTHAEILGHFHWLYRLSPKTGNYFGLTPRRKPVGVVPHCAWCEGLLMPDFLSPEQSQWHWAYLHGLPWEAQRSEDLRFQLYAHSYLTAPFYKSHAITEAQSLDQLMANLPTRAESRLQQDEQSGNQDQFNVQAEMADEESEPEREDLSAYSGNDIESPEVVVSADGEDTTVELEPAEHAAVAVVTVRPTPAEIAVLFEQLDAE